MMSKKLKELAEKLGKYKYAAVMVLVGTVILLWPKSTPSTEMPQNAQTSFSSEEEKKTLETELQTMLFEMNGVGNVRVLLSLAGSTKTVYWQDKRGGEDTETVYVQSGNEKQPTVCKTEYPTYRGAMIVCEGADNAKVILKIKEAVSSLTGLGSDKISVLKMKSE